MSTQDRAALQALLAHMRIIHEQLTEHSAGICVLHLEAAIAALETRLERRPAVAAADAASSAAMP